MSAPDSTPPKDNTTQWLPRNRFESWFRENPSSRNGSLALIVIVLFSIAIGVRFLFGDSTHRISEVLVGMTFGALLVLWLSRGVYNALEPYFYQRATRHRHQYIRNITANIPQSNRVARYWRYLRQNIGAGLVIFAVIGAVVPALFEFIRTEGQTETITLMNIGIVSGFVLASAYAIVRLYFTRRKHIIFPFTHNLGESPEPEARELTTITNTVTYDLMEHFLRIGDLLSIRQVEDINSRSEEALAILVTTQQNQQLAEQIRSIGSIEMPSVKFSPGGLFAALTSALAQTRIIGRVLWHQNKQIDIQVEFIRRNGFSLTAERSLSPDETGSISKRRIEAVTEELALEIVLKLGQFSDIASSVESLRAFLTGLEQASKRNWWQAIAAYRQTVYLEDARHNNCAIGHYHLGAALLSQGDVERGLEHLQLAEITGPPLPETQYMLALIHLYSYWDELHKQETVFHRIEQHCKTALELRPQFPEAYHLLGTASYRLGKLQHRAATKKYKQPAHNNDDSPGTHNNAGTQPDNESENPDKKSEKYNEHYRNSERYLQRAIQQYDDALSSRADPVAPLKHAVERRRLVRDRMIAVHHLGDALRSLKKYALAELYYQDFNVAYPRNARTLVDRAQNFCLYGDWYRADRLLRDHVTFRESTKWNLDANFYTAWAIAGGIAHRGIVEQPSQNLVLALARGLGVVKQISQTDAGYDPKDIKRSLLLDAFAHLDFALYQRPRFMSSWEHTHWQEPFAKAIEELTGQKIAELIKSPYEQLPPFFDNRLVDGLNDEQYGYLILNWLSQRMNSHNYQKYAHEDPIYLGEFTTKPVKDMAIDELSKVLKIQREFVIELLEDIDESSHAGGLRNTYRRLKIADELYTAWNEADQLLGEKAWNTDDITFANRWSLDVYADAALLLCRMLAEGRVYETLEDVTGKAIERLNAWSDVWTQHVTDFRFSPLVFRYQLATLRAWKAHAMLEKMDDPETRSRLYAKNEEPRESTKAQPYDQIEEELKQIFKIVERHPLALFVKARLYRRQKLYDQAIDAMNRLLTIIAPFDPANYIASWETRGRGSNVLSGTVGRGSSSMYEDAKHQPEMDETRSGLYYEGRISGWRQFDDFLDKARVHAEISELYALNKSPNSSIEHLLFALIWSPYDDLYVENFLRLADRLHNQDRFAEARTVVNEANAWIANTSTDAVSMTKRLDPLIMDCVLTSRTGDYFESLHKGETQLDRHLKETFAALMDKYIESQSESLLLGEKQWTHARRERRKNEINELSKMIKQCWTDVEDSVDSNVKVLAKKPIVDAFRAEYKRYKKDQARNPEYRKIARAFRLKRTDFQQGNVQSNVNIEDYVAYLVQNEILGKIMQPLTGTEPIGQFVMLPVIKSHIYHFIGKQALRYIEQETEIRNSIAYNKALLRRSIPDLEDARSKSLLALQRIIAIGKPSDYGRGRNLTFKERKAQYYDTLAWIYYGLGQQSQTNSPLEIAPSTQRIEYWELARKLLTENSLETYHSVSVSYYHLVRLQADLLDEAWDNLMNVPPNDVTTRDEHRAKANYYIQQLIRNWRIAEKSDVNGRLYEQLRIVRQRIDTYQAEWDKVRYKT